MARRHNEPEVPQVDDPTFSEDEKSAAGGPISAEGQVEEAAELQPALADDEVAEAEKAEEQEVDRSNDPNAVYDEPLKYGEKRP